MWYWCGRCGRDVVDVAVVQLSWWLCGSCGSGGGHCATRPGASLSAQSKHNPSRHPNKPPLHSPLTTTSSTKFASRLLIFSFPIRPWRKPWWLWIKLSLFWVKYRPPGPENWPETGGGREDYSAYEWKSLSNYAHKQYSSGPASMGGAPSHFLSCSPSESLRDKAEARGGSKATTTSQCIPLDDPLPAVAGGTRGSGPHTHTTATISLIYLNYRRHHRSFLAQITALHVRMSRRTQDNR